jgi:hypothetical protein
MSVDLLLALLNVGFCLWRLVATMRRGRLMALVWFLMTYFACFFIPVALTDHISFTRGFYSEAETADHGTIHNVLLFVIMFDFLFAVAEHLCWWCLNRREGMRLTWKVEMSDAQWELLLVVFGLYWVVGGAWWFWQTRGSGYREYVEGASWGSVIFWASSPVIVLAAMRRRWWLVTILCIPYLFFCVHLQVRSFALLSVVPVVVVELYRRAGSSASLRRASGRVIRYAIVAGALLVSLSVIIAAYRKAPVELPDSKMPFGVVETVAMVDRYHRHVGWDGLTLYAVHYINPFMKLLHVKLPDSQDTPTVIAQLLDGVPDDWPVLFHYPALIWADAYISFDWYGLWMAVLWAAVCCLWEFLMRRSGVLLALLLPYFCWHTYMLVRGAVAVASVPESYSLYLSLVPLLLVFGTRVLKKDPPSPGSHPTEVAAFLAGNLMR